MLKTIFRHITGKHFDLPGNRGLRFYPQKDFQYVLNRQREHADRYEMHFSLITFNFSNEDSPEQSTAALFDILSKRMRLSDEAGWINDSQIGLILFNTSLENAKFPVNDILKQFAEKKIAAPKVSVLIYPDNAFAISDHTGDNRRVNRLELQLFSIVTFEDEAAGAAPMVLKTKNISVSGVYFETEKTFDVSTNVKMSIQIPLDKSTSVVGDNISLNISGTVVRNDSGGVAISFKDTKKVTHYFTKPKKVLNG